MFLLPAYLHYGPTKMSEHYPAHRPPTDTSQVDTTKTDCYCGETCEQLCLACLLTLYFKTDNVFELSF